MNQTILNQHLRNEITSAQAVIERNHYTGSARNAYLVGVLRSTLAGMAGLNELHASCFDPETTQAVQKLIETIDQE